MSKYDIIIIGSALADWNVERFLVKKDSMYAS